MHRRSMVEPRAWAATRVGLVRSVNEDRYRVGSCRSDGTDANWTGHLSAARPWVMVADGMGGHGAGEVASTTAVDAFDRLFALRGPHDVKAVIDEANRQVFDAMAGPGGRHGMGTTVAGVCADGYRLNCFNVGDSRIYVRRGDRVLQMISVDHTPARRTIGVTRSHALTQSLGGGVVQVPLKPHVTSVDVVEGDLVLMCSDGLTDMLGDASMMRILEDLPAHPAAALADAAVLAGGRDNVTVVLLRF